MLNRIRLNARRAAINRENDEIWRVSDANFMAHGLQLVTTSTGAVFPGRQADHMTVPSICVPHTPLTTSHPNFEYNPTKSIVMPGPRPFPRLSLIGSPSISPVQSLVHMPETQITKPMEGAEDQDGSPASFLCEELDGACADLSDADMGGVYGDFKVLFGGRAVYPDSLDEDDHSYEDYLNELDGSTWVT
jgi:hypothetical protein